MPRRRRLAKGPSPRPSEPLPPVLCHVRRDLVDPDGRVHRGVRVPVYAAWTRVEELPGSAAQRCAARDAEARAIRKLGVRL